MRTEDLKVVFDKADATLKMLDTIPEAQHFFKDILDVLRDIIPLMVELQTSIEITSEKLPTASHQLDKVTAANELASTEILDIVERIITRIEVVQGWLRALPAATSDQSFENHNASLDSIKTDCTSIMIALQVQDITAQQIAAVNKMMQSVDQGLNALLLHIRGKKCGGVGDGYAHRHVNIIFDPSADYNTSSERQQAADAIVTNLKKTRNTSGR